MSAIRPALAVVVACTAFVSACVPVVANRYPAIDGTIVAGTAPVDDAPVFGDLPTWETGTRNPKRCDAGRHR